MSSCRLAAVNGDAPTQELCGVAITPMSPLRLVVLCSTLPVDQSGALLQPESIAIAEAHASVHIQLHAIPA